MISLLWRALAFRCRGEWESSNTFQKVPLLWSELVFVTVRFDKLLTLLGRRLSQFPDSPGHHAPSHGWKVPQLRKQLAGLLLLPGSKVLPGLHAIDNPLLLLGWKTVEMLQLLSQPLLSFGWQAPELRIILECFLLLVWRKVFVPPQPLSGVMLARP